jgi:hypothetical protein
MMCHDGYFVNCCPNKHAQRFKIVSTLTQASMKEKIVQLNRLQHHSTWGYLLVFTSILLALLRMRLSNKRTLSCHIQVPICYVSCEMLKKRTRIDHFNRHTSHGGGV